MAIYVLEAHLSDITFGGSAGFAFVFWAKETS